MSRVLLSKEARDIFFSSLKSKCTWKELATTLNVSERQIRDWRNGRYSMPYDKVALIKNTYAVSLPHNAELKPDLWYLPKAASLGGKRRTELYGSPGTLEGRRKGGLHSLKTHRRVRSKFIAASDIVIPRKSTFLAEIVGALIGDGGITPWQVSISLNEKNDKQYADYLTRMITDLFEVKVSTYHRLYKSTLVLVISSKNLVAYFHKLGLPIGNKLKQGLDIPVWVYQQKSWQKACLRGIFDTDGCTYVDSHVYKENHYKNIGIAFTTASDLLAKSITDILIGLGYSPTITTKRRISLRKEKEVLQFFQEINPSNHRHHIILKDFLEEYRSGHNGTVSKAVVAVK